MINTLQNYKHITKITIKYKIRIKISNLKLQNLTNENYRKRIYY